MKVAFYLPKAVYGGGERVLITLIRQFQNHGIDVVVYSRNTFGINIVTAKVIKLNTSINKVFQIIDAAKHFHKEKVSHIIIFGCDTILYWASRLTAVKYIYSLRIDPNQIDWSKLMYRHIINHCHKIVFQTHHVQKYFSKEVQSRSMVIFNPILDDNLPKIQIMRKKKIVMAGRLSKEKNYPMAIYAFSKVSKKGYKLHIYGVGPQYTELIQLVNELNLENDVVFEGQVDCVVEHIKDASIFMLTSNFEGMPNALIESMAMGLACISSNFPSGAAAEIITNNVDGYVVPLNDVDVLANKLQTLISFNSIRESFQKKASEIRERQDVNCIVNQWINFIK